MINTKHLFKVASAWISAVYVVCYAGVAIYPPIRDCLCDIRCTRMFFQV